MSDYMGETVSLIRLYMAWQESRGKSNTYSVVSDFEEVRNECWMEKKAGISQPLRNTCHCTAPLSLELIFNSILLNPLIPS